MQPLARDRRSELQALLNPRLLALFFAQAFATGATTASTVLASLIVTSLGFESLAGLPSTLVTLGAAFSAGLFGMLMVRSGRRSGLVGAYLLGVAGSALGFAGAQAHSVWVFLLGAAMVGAAQGGFQQGRYAAAESVPPRYRGAALGLLMFASVIGAAVSGLAAPLLDVLAPRLNTTPELLGWPLAAGLLLLSALLTLTWRETGAVTAGKAPAARTSWGNPTVRWAALALAVGQGVMVTLMSLTPLRAHQMGMHHAAIAGLVSVHVFGMFGFGWLTGPLIDRIGVRAGYAAGAALLVTAAATALLHGLVWLAPSMFLLGLGWNLCFVSGSAAMSAHRAAQGGVDTLMYLSSSFGAFFGGLLSARAGFPVLAVVAGVLSLLPLLSAALAPSRDASLLPVREPLDAGPLPAD